MGLEKLVEKRPHSLEMSYGYGTFINMGQLGAGNGVRYHHFKLWEGKEASRYESFPHSLGISSDVGSSYEYKPPYSFGIYSSAGKILY